MTQNPRNIDQLRDRLKALGYLDAPVDRYVLASATSRAGSARFALSASLRVGIIAGLLLGISAAIALAARAPGFIATRRDAVVLAVALTIVFTIAIAAAMAAAILVASWIARRASGLTPRRARAAAAAAGIIVALACVGYLTLWWNSAQHLFTGLTFAWNAIALAVAAAVALLLAHAASVAILAALVRTTSTADIAAGGLLSSRAFLVVFGIVLFAGSGALLASGLAGERRDRDAPPITVTPTGYALRVVGIDGFDLEVSRRLARAGELPALSRLLAGAELPLARERGAVADPARDWTTIATGQPAEIHGIASLESRRALGIEGRLPAARTGVMQALIAAGDLLRLTAPAVASGAERRVPAFWEIASASGLRTSVVNWWATWPAPEGDDVVMSDRAVLRLDTGGELDAEIAPASLYGPLRARWPDIRKTAAERAAAAFASIADAGVRTVMIRSAELDLVVASLAKVNDGTPIDLHAVYLPGLDIAQFNLLQTSGAGSVSAMSDRVAAIEHYYRFLDGVIAELLAPSASHINALILWPGRAQERDGAMVMAGPPVVDDAACADCDGGAAATLLYALGLPIAETLRSRPMTSAFSEEFRSRHPVRTVASYEAVTLPRRAGTGEPLDAEALERLRSLGYIR